MERHVRRTWAGQSKQELGRPHQVGRPSFLWSLPAITYFALFAILPLGVVGWLSLTSWNAIGSPHWIGTANWKPSSPTRS